MLTIDTNKTISFNRGDKVEFTFNADDSDGNAYTFLTTDVITLNVIKPKKYTDGVVFTKDFEITVRRDKPNNIINRNRHKSNVSDD